VCGENEVHPRKALISFAFPSCLSPTSERRLATVCFHCAPPPSFLRRGMTRKRKNEESGTKLYCIIKYNTARNSLISWCACVEHGKNAGKKSEGDLTRSKSLSKLGYIITGEKIYTFIPSRLPKAQENKNGKEIRTAAGVVPVDDDDGCKGSLSTLLSISPPWCAAADVTLRRAEEEFML